MALIAPGAAFPDRVLPTLDGRSGSVSDAWKEGPALFVIGHGDCGTTRLTLPFVDRMHRRCRAPATVALILQEEPDAARRLVSELALSVPAYLDPGPYLLSAQLGITTVPTVIRVDASGRVVSVSEGFERAALQTLASEVGVVGPLFEPHENAALPALRPG